VRICCFRSMLDLLCGIVSFLFGQPAQTAVETLRSVSKAVFGAGRAIYFSMLEFLSFGLELKRFLGTNG